MSRRDVAIGGCRVGGPVKCALLGPKPPPSDAILGRMSDSITVDVDGTEVKITHPDKVFFSARGETKLDLVRYYQAVAEPLLRTIGDRPVLLHRFPEWAGGSSVFPQRVRPEEGRVGKESVG